MSAAVVVCAAFVVTAAAAYFACAMCWSVFAAPPLPAPCMHRNNRLIVAVSPGVTLYAAPMKIENAYYLLTVSTAAPPTMSVTAAPVVADPLSLIVSCEGGAVALEVQRIYVGRSGCQTVCV